MENQMNKNGSFASPLSWLVAILLAASVAGCGSDTVPGPTGSTSGTPTGAGAGTGAGGLGRGPSLVNLGAAGSYVILAQSAITDAGASPITGDVGLSPAAGSFIGLTCAQVTGAIHAVDAAGPVPCAVSNAVTLTAAIGAKDLAYTDATGRAPDYTELGAGNIGGLNLGPATYRWGTGVMIPTNVTLTGGANDVWIFQIAQGLTVSPGAQIILAGGALPQNIFWATFAAADLDTTTQFNGIILSQTSVAMRTGASINGRLYAGTAVTLQGNAVTQP
jgi:hypothetical protein